MSNLNEKRLLEVHVGGVGFDAHEGDQIEMFIKGVPLRVNLTMPTENISYRTYKRRLSAKSEERRAF